MMDLEVSLQPCRQAPGSALWLLIRPASPHLTACICPALHPQGWEVEAGVSRDDSELIIRGLFSGVWGTRRAGAQIGSTEP